MKIAVCDDNPVFCNQMVQLIRQEEQENGQDFYINARLKSNLKKAGTAV